MADGRLLGKSDDGRTLRSIANMTRGLHRKSEQSLHAIADRMDLHESDLADLRTENTRLREANAVFRKHLDAAHGEDCCLQAMEAVDVALNPPAEGKARCSECGYTEQEASE